MGGFFIFIMNILIFNWQDIKNPLGGGAEVHLHEIFKRIVTMGHNVTLVSCKHKDLSNAEIIDGINVLRFGDRNLFNFLVPSLYKEIVNTQKFDVVIDDINKIPFFTPLFVKEPLLAISHHFFGTSIFKEAGLIAGTYVYLAEKLVDFIYKKTKFVVVSESTKDEFKNRGFDTSKFEIVYNALTQEDYPFQICEKEENPTITYFGRIKKYKSVDHLFHSFAKVKENIPNAKLWIIGRGDFQPNLEKLAEELNIANDVVFHGFVDDKKKIELLSKSHIVVNTSMKEGWGITNIEANACGTLVVSANVPGLRDSVKDGDSGLLYEYGNIDDLSNKLTSVLQSDELLKKLSQGALKWAKSFTWNDSANRMLSILESLVKHT